MTATKTKTAPAETPSTRTIEEWARLFADARAYVPVTAMTSEAGKLADEFNAKQAAQAERYRDELAIQAEEWDDAEEARRREWTVPPVPPGWSQVLASFADLFPAAVVLPPSREASRALMPVPVLAAPADPEAAAQHTADQKLAEWTHGQALADKKADEAVETLLDLHDTETGGETEVLDMPGEEE